MTERAWFDARDSRLDYSEAFTVWTGKARDCADVSAPLVCPDCGEAPDTVCGEDEQGAWWRLVCRCGVDLGGVGYRWK